MNIRYYTKYSRKGASSRLRSFQYFPLLQEKGYKIEVQSLFNDAYLDALYEKQAIAKMTIIKAYCKRFLSLWSLKKNEVIIIEKELFPYFFSWAERILAFRGIKYIVDYDDAIFHNYDLSSNKMIRFLLENKINIVMRNSVCVVAGNSYLANRAEISGAKKIEIIPTVIDLNRYQTKTNFSSKQITVGWIGSPSTFKYIKQITPVLKELVAIYNIRIDIVGAQEDLGFGEAMRFAPWAADTEVASILNFDIGIMPLQDTPWELGKCSYKLIQYMACGIPVVASAVGMNKEVVEEGQDGFLVSTNQEWFAALEKLILNPSLRKELGIQGRKKVELKYCLQQTNKKLISIIKDIK